MAQIDVFTRTQSIKSLDLCRVKHEVTEASQIPIMMLSWQTPSQQVSGEIVRGQIPFILASYSFVLAMSRILHCATKLSHWND